MPTTGKTNLPGVPTVLTGFGLGDGGGIDGDGDGDGDGVTGADVSGAAADGVVEATVDAVAVAPALHAARPLTSIRAAAEATAVRVDLRVLDIADEPTTAICIY